MYTHDYQLAGQRVRRYKGLFSIGDFVLMDGRTIDPFVLTREPSDSSRVFSVEKPTRADFRKFREMVQNLSSEYFILPSPLGKFISAPHRSDVWFTNEDQSEVYNILDNTSYVLYSISLSTTALLDMAHASLILIQWLGFLLGLFVQAWL